MLFQNSYKSKYKLYISEKLIMHSHQCCILCINLYVIVVTPSILGINSSIL